MYIYICVCVCVCVCACACACVYTPARSASRGVAPARPPKRRSLSQVNYLSSYLAIHLSTSLHIHTYVYICT